MQVHQLVYLLINSLSSAGDKLLLYALPVGIGLESKDVRSTILMFLIPGIAMRVSAFFSGRIKARVGRSIEDYSKLIVLLAFFEIILAVLLINASSAEQKILFCSAFVFLYAFAKEGISRIFFNVNIYKEVFGNLQYEKIISIDQILQIIFSFFGIMLASYMITKDMWALSLAIDAITFIIFGVGLYIIKKNVNKKNIKNNTHEKKNIYKSNSNLNRELKLLPYILAVIPFTSFVSCLFMPYLSVLVDKYSLMPASKGILIIGIVYTIVAFLNLGFFRYNSFRIKKFVLILIPMFFLIVSLLFNYHPTMLSCFLVILFSSLYVSTFMTVDYSIRNNLPRSELIDFNTKALQRMSNAQIVSCGLALIIYSSINSRLIIMYVLSVCVLFYTIFTFKKIVSVK